ncbi:MAG TPA: hypothetical protein VJY35_03280 [Candidatus Eisenbacteria bacterium]|nr:hypothetical protein [Candidatus Eisenbacteria bacterium]
MPSHTIMVTVDSGAIQVQPDTLVMTTQDEVQWATTNAQRFSIEFDGAGPFPASLLAYDAASAKQKPKTKGRFKYTVVSEANPGLRLDPVIVVDPPPTSGTGE